MRKLSGCLVAVAVGAAFCVQAAVLGPWEDTGDPIPAALTDAAAVVLDGKLYVIGGVDIFLIETDLVQVYDPSQPAGSRWSTAASLNQARFKHGATVYDGKIYVFGGEDLFDVLDSLEVYDPATDTWALLTPSGLPRANPGVTAGGGWIWVIGGERPDGGVSRLVQAYAPASDTWAGTYDDAGTGTIIDGATELPYGIDPNLDNYGSQMAAMSYYRNGVEYVAFTCGVGWNAQVGTTARIDASNIANAWVGFAGGPGARSGHAGLPLPDGMLGHDTIWVFGGSLGGFPKVDVSYFGESEGGVWIQDRELPEPLSAKPAAGRIGDYVYITAGLNAQGFENSTTYRARIVGPFRIVSIERPANGVERAKIAFTSSFTEEVGYQDLAADLYTFLGGLQGARVWFNEDLTNPAGWTTNVDSDVTVVDLLTTWEDEIPGVGQRHYRVERTPPAGTGILVEWGGVVPTSNERGDFDDLPYQPTDTDLLQGPGVTVTQEAGGYHPAAASIDMATIEYLADSPGGSGVAASGRPILPRDFAYDIPAIVARFDFPDATDIGEVRVFSSWEQGRCFQTYDLEYVPFGGGDSVRIATHVRSGPWGQAFGGNAKSYFTRVFSEDGGPIATGAGSLRINIYDVSNIAAPEHVYLPPAQAFQSPVIWEVDAFPPAQ